MSASKIKREKRRERERTMVNECTRLVERERAKERPRGKRTGKAQGERDGQREREREREYEPEVRRKNVGRNESSACRSRLHCFSKLARDRSHAREVRAWCRLVRHRRTHVVRGKRREDSSGLVPRFLSLSLSLSLSLFFSRDRCYLATRILLAREKVAGTSRSKSNPRKSASAVFLAVSIGTHSFDSAIIMLIVDLWDLERKEETAGKGGRDCTEEFIGQRIEERGVTGER